MEIVTIDGVDYIIYYTETKIGNTVYDKNTESTYIATIEDADDLNWILYARAK